MSRIRYYYDPETCRYERIKISKWDITLNVLGFLSVALILAIGILIIYTKYFESPKEAKLRRENEELKFYLELMDKEMARVDNMLTSLQQRDDNVYRTIFEADPIPATIREAGVGGTERYKDILEKGLESENLLVNTFQKIDKLKRQMYIQTKSYDDILQMAENKALLLAAIPAIQPIQNKQLTRLSSGFGMRIHPIYKVKMMHTGIDYSAPVGTPIFATGAGKVSKKRTSITGYGKQIEINHGFGYVTKYAHMSTFVADLGDEVKRGDLIGYVGNTGTSTGPHIHYEVRKNGKKVNPIHYFFQDLNSKEYEILVNLASIENQSL